MHEKRATAMAYVRRYGKPEFFITATTNPKWEEITTNLLPGQTAADRPDLVARVFHLKLNSMLSLMRNGAYGKHQASFHTIEYQKRGLPHAHMLLWVVREDKLHLENIDQVISAEIPCRQNDPELHELVMTHMIHGPCGPANPESGCMRDGTCEKDFPKSFRDVNELGNDSYPLYKRRSPENGGSTGQKTIHQEGKAITKEFDNRWVAPYSPFLLRQFKCHINVEQGCQIHDQIYHKRIRPGMFSSGSN